MDMALMTLLGLFMWLLVMGVFIGFGLLYGILIVEFLFKILKRMGLFN
jgi:hypothetical protein